MIDDDELEDLYFFREKERRRVRCEISSLFSCRVSVYHRLEVPSLSC